MPWYSASGGPNATRCFATSGSSPCGSSSPGAGTANARHVPSLLLRTLRVEVSPRVRPVSLTGWSVTWWTPMSVESASIRIGSIVATKPRLAATV